MFALIPGAGLVVLLWRPRVEAVRGELLPPQSRVPRLPPDDRVGPLLRFPDFRFPVEGSLVKFAGFGFGFESDFGKFVQN